MLFELEVLAKKFDRFGWDRDRGTPVHDRLCKDWMNTLQDYPLDNVQKACRVVVHAYPNRMPNEGHVKAQIMKDHAVFFANQPKPMERVAPPRIVSAEMKIRADEIVSQFARSTHQGNR